MKSQIKKMLLIFGALASTVPVTNAADGTITFSGAIHIAPCSIKPESADQTVQLGSLAQHKLASGGKSESRPVLIELEGCNLSSLEDKTVTTTFTAAPSDVVPGAIGTTGGVGIMMTHGGRPIVLGTPTAARLLAAGDNNTLEFGAYVQGQATGAIVPGEFSAVTNFTLAYQ